jgi:hypothetical protein
MAEHQPGVLQSHPGTYRREEVAVVEVVDHRDWPQFRPTPAIRLPSACLSLPSSAVFVDGLPLREREADDVHGAAVRHLKAGVHECSDDVVGEPGIMRRSRYIIRGSAGPFGRRFSNTYAAV